MAFVDVKFHSWTLDHATSAYVILPEKEKVEDCKVLYLLHGHGDDHTTWMRRTSIERYAANYGIAVVMPDGNRSFYSNTITGHNYYDFMAKELPMRMEQLFHISSKPEDKYIAGLSMGGYGALKIALRECGSYAAAAGLSSAADIMHGISRDFVNPVFGEKGPSNEDDLFWLAEQAVTKENKPRLFIGEGMEDFLYKDNVALRNKLDELQYEYTYKESHGDHSWAFWDEYIQYVLEWMFN